MNGIRTYKQASVEIRESDSIPPHLRDSVREVFDLKSAAPGQGQGSELMWRLSAEADRKRMVLMLLVTQPDEDGNKRLVEWYGRFGFKPAKDDLTAPVVMIRAPNAAWHRLVKTPLARALEMH